jgi:hypothetical protein
MKIGLLILAGCSVFALGFLSSCSGYPLVASQESPVKLAIIDSGIEASAFDCFPIFQEAEGDSTGHGTMVASIALAGAGACRETNSPRLEVYSFPVVQSDGHAHVEDISEAVDEARTLGIDVINISIATQSESLRLKTSIDNAIRDGIVVIAAAGNTYGLSAGYPALFPGVLSIGSQDAIGGMSVFSALEGVDYATQGENLAAIDRGGAQVLVSGTSFAAASITGKVLAGLLKGSDSIASDIEQYLVEER